MTEEKNINPDPIIYFNEVEYKRSVTSFKRRIGYMQAIMKAYNALNLGIISFEELPELIENTGDFVYDKITGGQVATLAGQPLNKEKAMALLDKPKGYDILLKEADNYLKFSDTNSDGMPIAKNYQLDAEGKIVLKQEVYDIIRSASEIRIKSEYAKTVNQFAIDILENLRDKKLDQFFLRASERAGIEFKDFIKELIVYDHKNKELIVNWEFIKHLEYASYKRYKF